MPSDVADVLADIERHIGLAFEFSAGFKYEAFRSDARTLYAVTRCLEIISEASRRLPEDLKARHPNIPWKNIAGAGNIYRHEYEDVDARLIWDTIQLALPPLQTVIAEEVERILNPPASGPLN